MHFTMTPPIDSPHATTALNAPGQLVVRIAHRHYALNAFKRPRKKKGLGGQRNPLKQSLTKSA